jgi:SAM-dependent MidA family methyltransferase
VTNGDRHIPWQQAWQQALYGPGGFYLRPEGPAGHFRTACHAGAAVLAPALHRLATEAGCTTIVDLGAGRGELLTALAALAPDTAEPLALPDDLPADLFVTSTPAAPAGTPADTPAAPAGTPDQGGSGPALRLHGVDLVTRPDGLPDRVRWSCGLDALPDEVLDGALVVAWELLDVVPIPIAGVDADGTVRMLSVDPVTGDEKPGQPLTAVEYAWSARWWPAVGAAPGTRIEIGAPRDALWAGLVKRVGRTSRGGLLLAVDYTHDTGRRPPGGSLSGFRNGRAVPPIPNGSCDLTSHVALDAVTEAGRRAGATSTLVLRQRQALRALGAVITPGDLASARAAGTDALLAQLELRSQLQELLDESGLGGFQWLLQGVRRPVPTLLH